MRSEQFNADFFNQPQQLQYQLGDLKIEIHQNTVEAKARYEASQMLKKREGEEGLERTYTMDTGQREWCSENPVSLLSI